MQIHLVPSTAKKRAAEHKSHPDAKLTSHLETSISLVLGIRYACMKLQVRTNADIKTRRFSTAAKTSRPPYTMALTFHHHEQ
jgi:hypothetical protein